MFAWSQLSIRATSIMQFIIHASIKLRVRVRKIHRISLAGQQRKYSSEMVPDMLPHLRSHAENYQIRINLLTISINVYLLDDSGCLVFFIMSYIAL